MIGDFAYAPQPCSNSDTTMNRKKKINQALKAAQKNKNKKLHASNKPKYISKAEREKQALESEGAIQPETLPTDEA
jgi:hypothetical protein